MAKTTAWLMLLIGVVWLTQTWNPSVLGMYANWILGLAFLAIGVTKLIRAYNYKKRR